METDDRGQPLLGEGSIEWQPVETAPYGVALELAVVNGAGLYAVVFPCRRDVYGWVNATSGALVRIHPTHWRQWREGAIQSRAAAFEQSGKRNRPNHAD